MRAFVRKLVVPAVLAVVSVGLATPAAAVVGCTFAAPVVTVTLDAGDTAMIARSGDAIAVNGSPCDTATVSNTDTVSVTANGVPGGIVIDLAGGPFEPGATVETDGGASEIEFAITMTSGPLRVNGSTGDDHVLASAQGINLNAAEATADADVTITGSATLTLAGGSGDDVLGGGTGGSMIDGGDGNDTADYTGSTQLTRADLASGQVTHQGGGVDTLVAIENLTGSPGDDLIVGNDADNVLRGGAGADTIDFGAATGGITVDLARGTAAGQGADTLAAIENVQGTAGDDEITGDGGANVLAGLAGDDTIDGGGDDDVLGGKGNDVLFGQSGNDVLKGQAGKDQMNGGDGEDRCQGGEDPDAFVFCENV
jgi:Ca2+-binding RTX toxin-like protein